MRFIVLSVDASAWPRLVFAASILALMVGCSGGGDSGGSSSGGGSPGSNNSPGSIDDDPNGDSSDELYGDDPDEKDGSGHYTVYAIAGAGGSIDPEGSVPVKHGDTQDFTVTVTEDNFGFGSVSGCRSGTVTPSESGPNEYIYTTGEIIGDCTVTAYFLAPVRVAAGDQEVTVAWNDVGSQEYEICYAKSGEESVEDPVNCGTSSTELIKEVKSPYSVEGLENGTTYWFRVASEDEDFIGKKSFATPGVLNDTGITTVIENSDTLGQDALFGRDASALAGTLHKTGGGAAGFDFTKIDHSGDELPVNANKWSCVRDNHTGLMWEAKVNDSGHPRHMGNTYAWKEIEDFVEGTGELCGKSDGWRVPTVRELLSIVHNGVDSGAMADSGYFPNAPNARYWSSLSRADNSDVAWTVDFQTGTAYWFDKEKVGGDNHRFRVRLVRSESGALGDGAACGEEKDYLEDNDDKGTVTHLPTGLTWMRCSLGQEWSDGTCNDPADGTESTMTWYEAMEAAAQVNAGNQSSGTGHANWRLPNKNELESMVERGCESSPVLNADAFPNAEPGWYWSSSPVVDGDGSDAWKVNFAYGEVATDAKDSQNGGQVRLVRTGDEPAPKAP